MRLSFKRDVSDELEMHVGETQTIVPIATSVAISYTHTHTMAGPLQGLVPLTGALRHNARLIPRRGPYAHSRSRPYHYTLARTEENCFGFDCPFSRHEGAIRRGCVSLLLFFESVEVCIRAVPLIGRDGRDHPRGAATRELRGSPSNSNSARDR